MIFDNTNCRNNRLSNIEILRIVSMLFIVIWHTIGHGIKDIDTIPSFDKNLISCLQSFIIVHVNCFVLITGYFGIHTNIKKLLRFIILIAFYVLIINAIALIITEKYISFSILFPISRSPYWFVNSYLCLFITAPFINIFIKNINQYQYWKLLLILAFVNVYLGFIHHNPINVNGYNYSQFVFLYFIGRYINIYKWNIKQYNSTKWLQLYIITSLIFIIFRYICSKLEISNYINVIAYNNPIVIMESICIFMCFKMLKIKDNNVINFIAKSAFSVYLIHDHPIVRDCITNFISKMKFNNIFTSLMLLSFLIFIICLVIDFIRRFIFKILKIYNYEKYCNFDFFKGL